MPYNLQDAISALTAARGDLNQTLSILDNLEPGVVIPLSDLKASLYSMSVDLAGTNKTVLYSGFINGELHSSVYASGLSSADASIAIINDTDAFKLLDDDVFLTRLEASASSGYDDLINGSTDPVTGKRVPNSLWDDISRSFAENASGEVIAVVPKADPYRVFAQTELPALLANENVTSINGVPKAHYIQYMDELIVSGMSAEDARVQLTEVVVKSQAIEYHSMKDTSFAQTLGSLDESTTSNMAKAHDFLKKLGVIGDVLALTFAVSEAQAAYDNGDTVKASQVMADWMADLVGGATAGYYTASVTATALAPLFAAGPAGAAAAGIITFGSGLFGAIAGGEAAKAFVDKLYEVGADLGLATEGVLQPVLDAAESAWNSATFHLNQFFDDVIALPAYLSGGVGVEGAFGDWFEPLRGWSDPLAVDLDGTGDIETLPADSVYFDIDADGMAEAVSWISSGDGWLARDVNANGKIDGVGELFGSDGTDGFATLAALDANADGKIDAQDAAYASLLVWQDQNSDGVSQAGELLSVADDLFIREISLTQANGTGTAEAAIGQLHVEDMVLAVDNRNAVSTGDVALDLDVLFLPELRGYGRMKNLSLKMSEDADLKAGVQALTAQSLTQLFGDFQDFRDDFNTVLYKWAGVNAMSRKGECFV